MGLIKSGFIFSVFVLLLGFQAAAYRDSLAIKADYQTAFNRLNTMLEKHDYNFKDAVYAVENAYFGGGISYPAYDAEIKKLAGLARSVLAANPINYHFKDSATVGIYAAIFRLMTDSVALATVDGKILYHQPYRYNFSDFDGSTNWADMFVATLLETHKGNCHSMPYLYKMIAHELGAKAWLSLAPNHIYLKLLSEQDGWYNTELTSGQFPIDAWVMASGYVHLNAIQNGIYMDTIGDRQSIAMCLVDLAQGYEVLKGLGTDSFMLQCCITALKYFPDHINALLLQSKVYERQFSSNMKASGITDFKAYIARDTNAKADYVRMNDLVTKIHRLGYRRMPVKMYLEWLAELKSQQNKYSNKKITNFTE
ncbi:hypothetical protein [Taibaiella koreensis]|uniref:hypothetical protein n=1 Tax=Taibaiella koreensis TaxID=1268548 RepID=UPI000E5999C3|nr:hypothetical protein [Taibaiella koreensis]